MADPITLFAIGSSLLGASQQVSAGQSAQLDSQVQAKQIETAAVSREADRKSALASAVASQSAQAGASGIQFEGSPLAILDEDIRREEEATQRDVFQSELGAQAALSRGTVKRRAAQQKAALGLLETGTNIVGLA